jgi:hypothetical protein
MEAAERFVEGVRFKDLEGSLEKQYALQRIFEISISHTFALTVSGRAFRPLDCIHGYSFRHSCGVFELEERRSI